MIAFLLLTGEIPFGLTKPKDIGPKISTTPITKEVLAPYTKLKPLAIDFLLQCLEFNESKRISSQDLLKHKWLSTMSTDVNLTVKEKLELGNGIKAFYKCTTIEKQICRFLAWNTELTSFEKKLRDLFKNVDTSKDGKISKQELMDGITKNKIDIPLTKAEIEKAFDEADTDKSGRLTFFEFITLFINKQSLISEGNLRSAFKELDKNGDGYITKDEIQDVKGAEFIMKEIDSSKDGKFRWKNS